MSNPPSNAEAASPARDSRAGSSISDVPKLKRILVLGLVLVVVALTVRYSPWAREFRYKRANLTQLQGMALATPADPLIHYYLGTQYFNEGRYPEALTAFEKASTLDQKMARAFLGMAVVHHRIQRYAEGYSAAKRAVLLDPKSADAQAMLAMLTHTASAGRAIEEYEKAVRLDPKRAEIWFRYGVSLTEAKQEGDAVQRFEQAVKLAPENGEYRLEFGKVLLELSRIDPACQQLEKAVELAPQDPAGYYYLAKGLATRATTDAELKRVDELLVKARDLLREAPAPEPRALASVYADRAAVLKRRGNLKEAMQLLETARRLDPKPAQILFQMSDVARAMGQVERANALMAEFNRREVIDREIFQLTERAKQDPKNPATRLLVARAFARAGDYGSAANQYQICLQLKPDQPAVAREFEALRKKLKPSMTSPAGTPPTVPAVPGVPGLPTAPEPPAMPGQPATPAQPVSP